MLFVPFNTIKNGGFMRKLIVDGLAIILILFVGELSCQTKPIVADLFAYESLIIEHSQKAQITLMRTFLSPSIPRIEPEKPFTLSESDKIMLKNWHGAVLLIRGLVSIPDDMLNNGKYAPALKTLFEVLPYLSIGYSSTLLAEKIENPSSENSNQLWIAGVVSAIGPAANNLGINEWVEEAQYIQKAANQLNVLKADLKILSEKVEALNNSARYSSHDDFVSALKIVGAKESQILNAIKTLLEGVPDTYLSSKEALQNLNEYLQEESVSSRLN
jgi:hypothetical protein